MGDNMTSLQRSASLLVIAIATPLALAQTALQNLQTTPKCETRIGILELKDGAPRLHSLLQAFSPRRGVRPRSRKFTDIPLARGTPTPCC